MMLKLKLDCSNAAFEGSNLLPECATILRIAADKLDSGHVTGTLTDTNGNRVGEFAVGFGR